MTVFRQKEKTLHNNRARGRRATREERRTEGEREERGGWCRCCSRASPCIRSSSASEHRPTAKLRRRRVDMQPCAEQNTRGQRTTAGRTRGLEGRGSKEGSARASSEGHGARCVRVLLKPSLPPIRRCFVRHHRGATTSRGTRRSPRESELHTTQRTRGHSHDAHETT